MPLLRAQARTKVTDKALLPAEQSERTARFFLKDLPTLRQRQPDSLRFMFCCLFAFSTFSIMSLDPAGLHDGLF